MELHCNPSVPLWRLYPKNPETPILNNLCSIIAQFIIAKYWKEPKCPSVNEWIKKTVVHLHNRILHSRKKGGAPTLFNSMDETGDHKHYLNLRCNIKLY